VALIVQKYGGTSVGTVERIRRVAERIAAAHQRGDRLVVVVSAMAGETDRLVKLAKALDPQPHPREMDVLLATGEQVTIALLSIALVELGCPARSYTGAQVQIRTDSAHTKARIVSIDGRYVQEDLGRGRVVIVAGFQGITEQGDITTLGRGGSDTTAVALAQALDADECQIYTDVDGVYTTDPRIVPEARRLDRLSFEEMLEMASLGSKVLQIRSVELASKYQIPVRVLSSFAPGPGTLICREEAAMMERPLIAGVAFTRDEGKLTILGVPDRPGVAYQILGPIAEANIEVDMIVQNVGADGTTDFTFTVHRNDYERALALLDNIAKQLHARAIAGDNKIAKISLVGAGMRSHAGVASKMFKALADEAINIQMISTSEIKVSVVVDEKYVELGVRVLHAAFGLDQGSSATNASA
jgi:aspartate kinase